MIIILNIVYRVLSAVFVITIHEFVLASMCYKLGDDTPKLQNRLNLNPMNHIEPIGLILCAYCGLGWGKVSNYRTKKKDVFLIYLLPLVVIFIIAVAATFLYKYLLFSSLFLNQFIVISISFVFLNLIPVPPLNGSKILPYFLTPNQTVKYYNMERTLLSIFILLVIFGFVNGFTNLVIAIYSKAFFL